MKRDFTDFQPSVDQIEAQVDRLVERTDDFLEWMSCEALADDIREPSPYFTEAGGISSVEMVRLGVNPNTDAIVCKAIFAELRRRFIDARLEQIQEAAIAKAQSDYQEASDEALS